MPQPKVKAGDRYGRLTVLELEGKTKDGSRLWRCACDCGKTRIVRANCLTARNTQSCGCLKAELSRTRMYKLQPVGAQVANARRREEAQARKAARTPLLQDENRKLFGWFASKLGSRRLVRENAQRIVQEREA
jgi:hypothetical protein